MQHTPSQPGSVRVVSKRKGGTPVLPGETVIDIDRSNPVLGNRHVLGDHRNAGERARVIAAHAADLEADIAAKGPMYRTLLAHAQRVRAGERIAYRCWCDPMPCHGHTYAERVREMAGIEAPAAPSLTPRQSGLF